MVDKESWTDDIQFILDNIRQNCVVLCEQHKKQYFYLKSWLKYFRLPCIILSSVNAVASIGLQTYVDQKHVSLLNCMISLITTIITSTELYLQIEKRMSTELEVSQQYYIMSVDIKKMLDLNVENRNIDGSSYLDNCMSNYKNLFEQSGVLPRKMRDKLTTVDCDMVTPDLPGLGDMPCNEYDFSNKNYFSNIKGSNDDQQSANI